MNDATANNIEPSARKDGLRVPNAALRHRHLTPAMRAALSAARSQPLRRVHDERLGRPSWPAHPCTLHALVRRELARRAERLSRQGHRVEEWWITDLGVEVLKSATVVSRDPVRLLHVPGGSTRLMQLGVWVDVRMPEPEDVRYGYAA